MYAIVFLVFIILGVIFSKLCLKILYAYYNKTNRIFADINKTSFEILCFFIMEFHLNVKIAEYSTHLDNSYNIKRKLILLSKDVINDKSVGAIAIAMHELGHAIQHNTKSKLFYFYYFLSILNRLTSALLLPLIMFLIVSLFLPAFYLNLALILVLVFYLINLLARIFIIPLEKNASKIALKLLKDYNIMDSFELKKAKKLLNLAYLTYVGGFFQNYIKIFKKILRSF